MQNATFPNFSHWRRRWKILIGGVIVLFVLFWSSLPRPLFQKPTSTVIEAVDGRLLGAKIATDGQWRFPFKKDVPEKFAAAIITFEDKRFYRHIGIDFRALGRAVYLNIKNRKIVSGASTLSMQVIRLYRDGTPRNVWQKLIEMVLTFRLELGYSKKEILNLYAGNAPFGGNVVGLEAAAWRYFGKSSPLLSWAEAATLAVLPNSPSLIHPGRNREALEIKRNKLLKKLLDKHIIAPSDYELALGEPLPRKPFPLPRLAPHLLERIAKQQAAGRQTRTSIDADLQLFTNQVVARYNTLLKNNEIHNLAVLIIDVETQQVVTYVGNAQEAGAEHGQFVDIIQSPRSTGSILKPFLYAMMLKDGQILPRTLIADIPMYLNDFRPENFSNTFDGVVPADDALSRSLNLPFVRLLQQYSVEKFHFNLKKMGITTLHREPSHYGLSLILGGAETTLWDLVNCYASMAKRLRSYYPQNGRYHEADFQKATFDPRPPELRPEKQLKKTTAFLTADAIWLTFKAMKRLERPDMEGDWQRFGEQQDIAWKTGTSFGFRDAWAIGVNSKYCVGVWAGNADGEGRPGLTGIAASAPVLFEVFNHLPNTRWFDPPYDELKQVPSCRESGYLAREGCPIDSVWATTNALQATSCPFHLLIYLDSTSRWRVLKNCPKGGERIATYWYSLPPIEEHYYKPRHPDYRVLPPFHSGCGVGNTDDENQIELIYPAFRAQIYVPVELDGTNGKAVFQAVHKNPKATIHWHINKEYIGSTKEFHSIACSPGKGKHILTIVDEFGNRLQQRFEILTR